jgi:hypothetical protein
MNKSLANLQSKSSNWLVFGILAIVIGFVLFFATASSTSPNMLGVAVGYFLIAVGALLVNLGVIGKFLEMTSKAIIEGLNGNIKTSEDIQIQSGTSKSNDDNGKVSPYAVDMK